ncbi:MAG: TRM11 family SAM-dependent methyltransferase [Armatimonadota bacterium]
MSLAPPSRRGDLASLPLNFWLVGQEGASTQRRGRYTPASLRHPGKMLPALAREILAAYTQPGDWVLDPMSGIGTTGVEALHLGRHYVGIELEPRFAAWQRQNLTLARRQGAAGTGVVYQGDARRLAPEPGSLPEPSTPGSAAGGPIDAVITSPPYGDRLASVRTPSRTMQRLIERGRFGGDIVPGIYGRGAANLGNLPDAEYLREMRAVYAGCLEVLKPGGILAVVIQPGRDRHRLRPLHHETARICVELGFELLDERVAILSRIEAERGRPPTVYAHSHFFKRLAAAHLRDAGYPVSLGQLEYVLVFRKPGFKRPGVRTGQPKSGLSTALGGDPRGRGEEDLLPAFLRVPVASVAQPAASRKPAATHERSV